MSVNVNRSVSDQFYRYKMPHLIAKIEGKGNGIKTVIVNMVDVAKALNRPPTFPTKFFGCELGAKTHFDSTNERYTVNGSHEANKLQDMLDGFIRTFVLCPECDNPETDLNVNPKKQTIGTACKACGYCGMLDTRHKLCTFILKNPPENNDGGSASAKKEKEKKNRKKDKENGSGSGEAENQDNFDAPQAVLPIPVIKVREETPFNREMDQSRPNNKQGGAPQHAVPVKTLRQGNAPVVERSIISGDNIQFGRLRRHTRLSQSENQSSGAEEEWLSTSMEASGSYGQSPTLKGMQAEPIWYNRSSYEQAEGNYQRRLASTGNGPLSSSPRSPNTRGFSRRTHNHQQDQSHPVTTVKSSGTPHRRYSRGRNRTSSETEQGGKGSRGPMQRKRGLSETESRPRRDNTNMSGLQCLATENIWFDKHRYDEAEKHFYEGANGPSTQQHETEVNAILQDIAKSRKNIQQSLNGVKTALQQAKGRQQKRQHRNSSSHAGGDHELISRMKSLELENQTLHKVVEEMRAALQKLESRVVVLEKTPGSAAVPCAKVAQVQAAPVKQVNGDDNDDDDDDDIDLFGSDEEDDDELARLKQERLDAYAAKKAKKPTLIAKSSILLDVKPWDDETDMAKLEECVRSVQMDGLLWGASKLVPVGYGIKKLQINCVVEDDKVGTDILEEEITKFEDFIQSVDVAAFNKI